MTTYKIKYRMKNLILLTHSYEVDTIDENEAKRKFYQLFDPTIYEIVSIEKLYGGCLTGNTLFWLISFGLIFLLVVISSF